MTIKKINYSRMKKHYLFNAKSFTGLSLVLWLFFAVGMANDGQAQSGNSKVVASAILPGKGLSQFDFFYAGEAKDRNMYIVRNGKIAWSYIDTLGRGEISDAVLMTNGNIFFAYQYSITLISPEKKVLWNYEAPNGCEIHTGQPIGKDRVVFVQNGEPAKVIVMNIHSNKIEKQFELTVANPKSVHGQFRHARLTPQGTLMVAHMDRGKVCEYDSNGNELWSLDVPGIWGVEPLKNGNILICGSGGFARELNKKGETVWEFPLQGNPGFPIPSPQIAFRRSNGNTIINNWHNQWQGEVEMKNQPLQAIEVTHDKKVVWALRSWSAPANLGPSTIIQLLNEPGISENVSFGEFR
jgi:outer membrane protein assembly factor BamB